LWAAENPGARDPDWPDCPCCVSDLLGVECATVDIGGDDYPEITVVALGSAMATAACVMACCCKMKKVNRRPGTGGKGSTKSLATELSRSPD
ncbi:unnamed protein product, partial [Ectocarpus sp. 8 AP-2014]